MYFFKRYINSKPLHLMIVLLLDHLGKQMCVKCVGSKVIVGMRANLAICSKILPLNKPMLFTTSIIDHKMIATPILLIRVQGTTQIFSTKISISFLISLTNLHKITFILPSFQYWAPQFEPPQPPPQKSNLESLMEGFI